MNEVGKQNNPQICRDEGENFPVASRHLKFEFTQENFSRLSLLDQLQG